MVLLLVEPTPVHTMVVLVCALVLERFLTRERNEDIHALFLEVVRTGVHGFPAVERHDVDTIGTGLARAHAATDRNRVGQTPGA